MRAPFFFGLVPFTNAIDFLIRPLYPLGIKTTFTQVAKQFALTISSIEHDGVYSASRVKLQCGSQTGSVTHSNKSITNLARDDCQAQWSGVSQKMEMPARIQRSG